MRRSSLLTITALGGLICLIGGTGLFAALTDTARTGTNSVDSAPLAGSADIQLALGTRDSSTFAITCGAFSEDLATAFFSATGVEPGYISGVAQGESLFCIRNVGSQSVTLSALTTELTDVDFGCTGDESLHGDTTCGGDQLGELSGVLRINYSNQDCTAGSGSGQSHLLSDNAVTPHNFLGSLGVGATDCFSVSIQYPPNTATDAVQRAQSDRATWRITFTAQS